MAEKLGNASQTPHMQSTHMQYLNTKCPMIREKLKHPSFAEELIYKNLLAIIQIFSYTLHNMCSKKKYIVC